ncbi:hypothetical protein PLICRDRAFT_46785 [Plicaturopsis crispa FD-325 SS-3]|uniref:Secreted protein n=1 Tax=Plicaturopsis crispa FD-325 SS-3 TaxID=944288 RepID=A0A0C9SWX3_PLICR|nr:hypothetical protein PLICRDRAFT_46785 [Plicaturopsis crispa FD-325 SS-3]
MCRLKPRMYTLLQVVGTVYLVTAQWQPKKNGKHLRDDISATHIHAHKLVENSASSQSKRALPEKHTCADTYRHVNAEAAFAPAR